MEAVAVKQLYISSLRSVMKEKFHRDLPYGELIGHCSRKQKGIIDRL